MRTTLTLDDDVAALLRRAVKNGAGSFKEVVNEALRRGLQAPRPPARRRYRVPALQIGGALVSNLDDVHDVLAVADGDDHS